MWQGIYEQLKDKNFVVISVALDSAGAAAARPAIEADGPPPELGPVARDLMGWDDDLWSRSARATYPSLIDEKHLVSELYDMVNVPTAVWIDENGRIVRPAESGGSADFLRKMDRATFAMPDEVVVASKKTRRVYVDAIRDWVEKGEKSRHVLKPAAARERTRVPEDDDSMAMAWFRIGKVLYERGEVERAQTYLNRAVELRPESWNFRRQAMILKDPALTGQLNTEPGFWAAVDALGDKAYYEPIQMEGIPKVP